MKTLSAIAIVCSLLMFSCKDQSTRPLENNTLYGTVHLYSEYGDTLTDRSGVLVEVENTSITGLSNSIGEWNLSSVPVGDLAIDFSKERFNTSVQSHVMYSGGTAEHSTLDIPLFQTPTYTVDSISIKLSMLDSSIIIEGSVSALSKSSLGKRVVLLFGFGPTISSRPNGYNFIFDVNVEFGVLTFSKSISFRELKNHYLMSGQELFCIAYPSVEGQISGYNDPHTSAFVITSIGPVGSNVAHIVVP